VQRLLEELQISLQSFSSSQSLRHTISPRVRVGVWFWARSQIRSSTKETRTPHPWWAV